MLSTMPKYNKRDLMNYYLNDDCLKKIFSRLPPLNVLQVEQVCIRWATLCHPMWKKITGLYSRDGVQWCTTRMCDYHEYLLPNMGHAIGIFRRIHPFILRCRITRTSHPSDYEPDTMMTMLKTTIHSENEMEYDITLFDPLTTFPLHVLMRDCVNLERLTLVDAEKDGEGHYEIFLSRNANLKYFTLEYSGCIDTSDHVTGEMLGYLPSDIEEIVINQAYVDPFVVMSVLNKFHCLQSFGCHQPAAFQDPIAVVIGRKRTLKKLTLTHVYKFSNSFCHIRNLPNLKELDLRGSIHLEDSALAVIAKGCKQLESLDISACRSITNDGVSSLRHLKKLRHLKMDALARTTDRPIAVLPSSLRTLSCMSCFVYTDRGFLRFMNRARNLTLLNVRECLEITHRLIREAIRIARQRTDNISMEIWISEFHVREFQMASRYGENFERLPSLLKVVSDNASLGGEDIEPVSDGDESHEYDSDETDNEYNNDYNRFNVDWRRR